MTVSANVTVSATLATLVAAGAVLLAATPAFAASAMTDAFIANVRPNVEFLDGSSRLALNRSPSASIRRFARSEAVEQTITGNSLVAWAAVNAPTGAAIVVGEPVGPVGAAPFDVENGVINGVSDVVTGRSVVVDTPAPLTVRPASPVIGGALLPSQQTDMSRLQDLSGRPFDALYRSTQLDALRQLQTLYQSYIQNGDDPALREIAVRELPKIIRRVGELQRV